MESCPPAPAPSSPSGTWLTPLCSTLSSRSSVALRLGNSLCERIIDPLIVGLMITKKPVGCRSRSAEKAERPYRYGPPPPSTLPSSSLVPWPCWKRDGGQDKITMFGMSVHSFADNENTNLAGGVWVQSGRLRKAADEASGAQGKERTYHQQPCSVDVSLHWQTATRGQWFNAKTDLNIIWHKWGKLQKQDSYFSFRLRGNSLVFSVQNANCYWTRINHAVLSRAENALFLLAFGLSVQTLDRHKNILETKLIFLFFSIPGLKE